MNRAVQVRGILCHTNMRFYSAQSVSGLPPKRVATSRAPLPRSGPLKAVMRRPEKLIVQAEAELGSPEDNGYSVVKKVELSPRLQEDVLSPLTKIIRLHRWFIGIRRERFIVQSVSSVGKNILRLTLYLSTLLLPGGELDPKLSKKDRKRMNELAGEIVSKISNASNDFGLKITKFGHPVLKIKTTEGYPGGFITLTIQISTKLSEMLQQEETRMAGMIQKHFKDVVQASSDKKRGPTSKGVYYGELNREGNKVYQQLFFTDSFESKVFNMVKALVDPVANFELKDDELGEASAEICFADNKLYFTIDTNLVLNQRKPRGILRTDEMETSGLISLILEALGNQKIKFRRVTSTALVYPRGRLSIEANVDMEIIGKTVVPSQNERLLREFHSDILESKILLDAQAKREEKCFKFLNFDKLENIGVGRFLTSNGKSKAFKMLISREEAEGKYAPIQGLPDIQVTTLAGKNLSNPTNTEVIKQLGMLVLREMIFFWTISVKRESASNFRKVSLLVSSFLQGMGLIASDNVKISGLSGTECFYVYVGLWYMEGKSMVRLKEWIKAHARSVDTAFHYDRDAVTSGWRRTLEQVSPTLGLNGTVWSLKKRRHFLHNALAELPQIPDLKHRSLYPFLRVSMIHGVRDAHGAFLKNQLDYMGDALMKRFSVEYFVQLLQQDPRFHWSMDDIHFMNTNIIFSQLALSYKLHRAVKGGGQFVSVIGSQLARPSNSFNEMLGDMFERLVAIQYLDDPVRCRDWVFGIYDTIRGVITVHNEHRTILGKEQYLEALERLIETSSLYK
ncbi:hypothetical protein Cantr_02237 [Candida viswanathii]|uniref:Uncharacterized protein n=1 Tax=Candida viswanathii TaxID=5486 RepID=A0A367YQJ2_9ASCO|nr:hypothetical protein Cantr_02237 [Candida viswanathii]